MIDSHGALLAAVHEQPEGAVTATGEAPPEAPTERLTGATAKLQPPD